MEVRDHTYLKAAGEGLGEVFGLHAQGRFVSMVDAGFAVEDLVDLDVR